MSQRIAATYEREEFSVAIKRERWRLCGGRCDGCGKDLQPSPDAPKIKHVYDHKWPLRLGGDASIDNCQLLCDDGSGSCNDRKTHGLDLPGIAAAKRYGKNRLPLDIDRPEREPSKIPQRPNATWPKREFPKGASRWK